MCCARTAALQGGTKNQSFLQQLMHHVNPASACKNPAKNCTRSLPKPSLDPPPNLPKSRPGASMRAKMRPRVLHECPRGTPEAPKRHPRAPKRRPRTPKRRPRDAREAPRPLQNRGGHGPRCILGIFFAGTSVRKAPGSIFDRFLRRTWTGRHVFRYGFFHTKRLSDLVSTASARARKNLEKYVVRPSKTLSGPTRNPPKSGPGRPRTSKKQPRRAKTG